MSPALAQTLLAVAGAYFGAGLLFALAFVAFGAGRIDRAAAGGSIGFRILIVPGSALLWPLLARRWLAGGEAPPEERDAHVAASRAGARP